MAGRFAPMRQGAAWPHRHDWLSLHIVTISEIVSRFYGESPRDENGQRTLGQSIYEILNFLLLKQRPFMPLCFNCSGNFFIRIGAIY
jgi:hypothetical protein